MRKKRKWHQSVSSSINLFYNKIHQFVSFSAVALIASCFFSLFWTRTKGLLEDVMQNELAELRHRLSPTLAKWSKLARGLEGWTESNIDQRILIHARSQSRRRSHKLRHSGKTQRRWIYKTEVQEMKLSGRCRGVASRSSGTHLQTEAGDGGAFLLIKLLWFNVTNGLIARWYDTIGFS